MKTHTTLRIAWTNDTFFDTGLVDSNVVKKSMTESRIFHWEDEEKVQLLNFFKSLLFKFESLLNRKLSYLAAEKPSFATLPPLCGNAKPNHSIISRINL